MRGCWRSAFYESGRIHSLCKVRRVGVVPLSRVVVIEPLFDVLAGAQAREWEGLEASGGAGRFLRAGDVSAVGGDQRGAEFAVDCRGCCIHSILGTPVEVEEMPPNNI